MSSSEVWYVKLASGEVHQVTLDQIEEAFDGGRIDSAVLVRQEGTEEWKTLAELAGLDDVPPAAAPPVAVTPPVAYVPPAASVAPVGYVPQRASVPPAASAAPVAYVPQQASVRPAAYVPPTASVPPMAYVPPVAYAPAAASVRPVAYPQQSVPTVRPAPYSPSAASVPPGAQANPAYTPPPAYVRPYIPEPASTGAVSADFGDSDVSFRRSRKGWVVAVLGVAAAAGFVCVSVMRSRASMDAAAPTVVAAKPAPVMALPPEPTPAPPSPAPPSMGGAQSSNDSPLNPRFTDQQRQKLIDADKQRDEKTKAKPTSHATGGAGRAKSTGFTKGGSKFDPLNSAI